MSEPNGEPLSFGELAGQPEISSRELLDTMAVHAENGLAIKGALVIELAERAGLKTVEFGKLGYLAQQGLVVQQMGRNTYPSRTAMRETAEYLSVLGYARYNIAAISVSN